jgi:hypothetical protein
MLTYAGRGSACNPHVRNIFFVSFKLPLQNLCVSPPNRNCRNLQGITSRLSNGRMKRLAGYISGRNKVGPSWGLSQMYPYLVGCRGKKGPSVHRGVDDAVKGRKYSPK